MTRFDRRRFLVGAGGAVLALPFVDLWSHVAHASPDTGPLRLLVFFHEAGTLVDEWTPAQSGTSFDLTSGLPAGEGVLSPLTPFQDRIVVVSGLSTPTGDLDTSLSGHGRSKVGLLTGVHEVPGAGPEGGWADGPSVDEVIASRLGPITPKRSIHTIVGETDVTRDNVVFFAGPDTPVTSREPDPVALYANLFGNFMEPGQMPDPAAEAELRRKRSVLDAVGESFKSYRARLGSEQRQRLDAHASYVRDIEQRLQSSMVPPAGGCAKPGALSAVDLFDHDTTCKRFADLIAMAFACDLTRVAAIQLATTHNYQFPWAGVDIPYASNPSYGNWHDYVHDPVENQSQEDRRVKRAILRWHMDQLAYVLAQLDGIPEGDGTVLDNTLVVSLSDHGHAGYHYWWDLPVVLAGGACGRLQTGRHVPAPGRSNHDLLVSILNLFGYDDTSFGLPQFNSGGLSGIA